MYFVTYRNVLQPDATLDDYRKGLRHVWPTLQSWGAASVEMFQDLYDESGAFYTRYAVASLDTWNRHIMSEAFRKMLTHLEEILDLAASEVTVGVSLETGVE
jgi:hypothetical protein